MDAPLATEVTIVEDARNTVREMADEDRGNRDDEGPTEEEIHVIAARFNLPDGNLRDTSRWLGISEQLVQALPPLDGVDFARKVFAGDYTLDDPGTTLRHLRLRNQISIEVKAARAPPGVTNRKDMSVAKCGEDATTQNADPGRVRGDVVMEGAPGGPSEVATWTGPLGPLGSPSVVQAVQAMATRQGLHPDLRPGMAICVSEPFCVGTLKFQVGEPGLVTELVSGGAWVHFIVRLVTVMVPQNSRSLMIVPNAEVQHDAQIAWRRMGYG